MPDEKIADVYVDVSARNTKLLAILTASKKVLHSWAKDVQEDNVKTTASAKLLDDRVESLRRTLQRLKAMGAIGVKLSDAITKQLDRVQLQVQDLEDTDILVQAHLVGSIEDDLRDVERLVRAVDADKLTVQTDDERVKVLRAELENIKKQVDDLNSRHVDIDVDLKTAGALTKIELTKRQLDLLALKSISVLRAIKELQGSRIDIGVRAGADRDLEKLEKDLRDILNELHGVGDIAKVDIDVTLREHVHEQLNELADDVNKLREPVDVKVAEHGVDDTLHKLEELQAEADHLDGDDINIDVDVDIETADERLARLTAELDALRHRKTVIMLNPGGSLSDPLVVMRLRRELDELDNKINLIRKDFPTDLFDQLTADYEKSGWAQKIHEFQAQLAETHVDVDVNVETEKAKAEWARLIAEMEALGNKITIHVDVDKTRQQLFALEAELGKVWQTFRNLGQETPSSQSLFHQISDLLNKTQQQQFADAFDPKEFKHNIGQIGDQINTLDRMVEFLAKDTSHSWSEAEQPLDEISSRLDSMSTHLNKFRDAKIDFDVRGGLDQIAQLRSRVDSIKSDISNAVKLNIDPHTLARLDEMKMKVSNIKDDIDGMARTDVISELDADVLWEKLTALEHFFDRFDRNQTNLDDMSSALDDLEVNLEKSRQAWNDLYDETKGYVDDLTPEGRDKIHENLEGPLNDVYDSMRRLDSELEYLDVHGKDPWERIGKALGMTDDQLNAIRFPQQPLKDADDFDRQITKLHDDVKLLRADLSFDENIDTEAAKEKFAQIEGQLKDLQDQAKALDLDIDTTAAQTEIDAFRADIERPVDVPIDIDAPDALRKEAELRAELSAPIEKEIHVKADSDALSSMVFLLGLIREAQIATDKLNELGIDPKLSQDFVRSIDEIEVRLNRLNNQDVRVAIDVVGDANAQLLRLIADVEKLDGEKADIDVEVDEEKVRAAIQRIHDEVRNLALDKVEVEITGVDRAEAEIKLVDDRLSELDAKDVAPNVDVHTAGAEAHLKALEAELDRLDGKDVTVDVNVDKKSRIFSILRGIIPGGGGRGGGGANDAGGFGLFGGGGGGFNPLRRLGQGAGLDFGRAGIQPQTAGISALVALATALLPMLPALTTGLTAIIGLGGVAVGVIGTLAIGLTGLSKAIAGDVEAYKQLSPEQQKFVRQIQALLPILKQVRTEVANTLLPKLSVAAGGFFTPENIASITSALKVFAGAIGDAAIAVSNFVNNNKLVQEFSDIMKYMSTLLQPLTVGLLNFIKAFFDFTKAMEPLITYSIQLFTALMNLLSAWIENAVAVGRTQKWIASTETAMGLLIQTVVGLWRVLQGLLAVLTPIGLALLKWLLPAFDDLSKWLNAHVKQIDAFAIGIGRLAGVILQFLWPGIKLLVVALAGLVRWMLANKEAAAVLVGVLLALIAPFTAIAIAAVGAFSLIAKHWDALSKSPAGKRIIEAFHDVVHAIEVAGPAIVSALSRAFDWILNTGVPALVRGFHKIQPTLEAVWKDMKVIFADIVVIIQQAVVIIVALWNRFGGLIVRIVERDFKAMARIVKDVFDILADLFNIVAGVLTGDWGKVWTAIKDIPKKALDIILVDLTTWAANFFDFWKTLLKQLYVLILQGLEKAIGLFAKIPTSFKIRGHRVGFKNPFQSLKDDLDGYIKDLTTSTDKSIAAVDEVNAKVRHGEGLAAQAAGKAADNAKKKNKEKGKDKDPLGLDAVFAQIKKQQDQSKKLFGQGGTTDLTDPGKFKAAPTSADAAANQIVPLKERKTFLIQLKNDLKRISELPEQFQKPMRASLQKLFKEISNPKLTEKEFQKLRPQLTKQLDAFVREFTAAQINKRVTGKDQSIVSKALNLGVIDQAQANKVQKQIQKVVEAYNVALRDHFLSPAELRRIKSRAQVVADSIKSIQDAMKNATQQNKDYVQALDAVVSKFASFASNITGLTSQKLTLGSPYVRAPVPGGIPVANASSTSLSTTLGYKTSTQTGGAPVIGEQNVIINHPTDPYVAAQKARHATEAEFSRLRAVGG